MRISYSQCFFHQNIILTEPEHILSDFIITTDSIFEDSLCQFQNLSIGGSYYNWDFGDGSSSNEINPTHSFSNPGLYLTSLKVSNDSSQNCSSESLNIVEVNGLTSLNLTKQTANFSLTQNNNNVFLHCKNNHLIKSIKIFDSKGILIYHINNMTSDNLKITTSDFRSGIFIIHINSYDEVFSKFFYIK